MPNPDTALPIVTVTVADMLAAYVAAPPYWALKECEPALNEVVENVAVPWAESVAVPITVVPSRKLTLPVGVPADAPTVAVNTTDCPAVVDVGAAVKVVVVAVFATLAPVWLSNNVEPTSRSGLPSPLKSADIAGPNALTSIRCIGWPPASKPVLVIV